MILTEYVIEREFVNKFIQFTFDNPLVINGIERRLFIWGHEILLPDGKGDYNSGILDLIGTDERGEVWLIEAKLNSNKEWNSNIWENQLGLYAKSLRKRSEQEIVLGARRYIVKESAGTLFPPFILDGTNSLSDAFCQWASSLTKDKKEGLTLYETTMRKIMNGEIIQCVLSNEPGQGIWENRPKGDSTARAYITFQKMITDVVLEQNKIVSTSFEEGHWSHGTWISFIQKKNEVKPTPDKIPLLLADGVIPIYERILSFILEIGWNGKYVANQKAFRFDLQTVYEVPLRIQIGWIDADGQQDIQYRTPYQFGLKFNIDFRHFKRHVDTEIWETGYKLAKELAEKGGYNIRGGEFSIFDPYWTAEKVKDLRWDGEMYRFISQRNRDNMGLEEEQHDLNGVFLFLRKVIKH